jgi:hypothetical protein
LWKGKLSRLSGKQPRSSIEADAEAWRAYNAYMTLHLTLASRPTLRCCLLALLLCATSAAAELATIELTDGSTIKGQINTLANGVYAVDSDSLGLIQIPQSRVRSIRYGSGGAPQATPSAADLGSLQMQLMADPQIMNLIGELRSDPQMQALLDDPEIQRAVSAGDIGALINNPKFLDLLNNARVQEITRRASQPR